MSGDASIPKYSLCGAALVLDHTCSPNGFVHPGLCFHMALIQADASGHPKLSKEPETTVFVLKYLVITHYTITRCNIEHEIKYIILAETNSINSSSLSSPAVCGVKS